MTPEQVREIVKMTLDELTDRKLIELNKVNYAAILIRVDDRLNAFFKSNAVDKSLSAALRGLSDDEYIDIIYLQYRDCKTLEWIAEYLGREVSTIKRNKKRLILSIWRSINETIPSSY